MLLIEQISAQRQDIKLQIFASDVDEHALSIARAGIYPDSIEADVSSARLNRFFTRHDHTYHVTTELPESVVFARQNLLAEPPFSRLHLISCRNLLIYLNIQAQERVLSMFHFALNNDGLLLLGPAESLGTQEDLFKAVTVRHRVYVRTGLPQQRALDFPISPRLAPRQILRSPGTLRQEDSLQLAEISRALLIEKYAPAAALINTRMEVLYTERSMDAYLQVPGGEPSQDILQMARQGLRVHLGIAIRKAIQNDEVASSVGRIVQDSHRVQVRITVHPVLIEQTKLYLVAFTERYTPVARNLLNVISTDIDQPFADITSRIDDTRLLEDAREVLSGLVPILISIIS